MMVLAENNKDILVYFIPAFDEIKKEKMFFYAIVSKNLKWNMDASLGFGIIPDFCTVVEKGFGEPSTEVKERIKNDYGFIHA